MAISLGGLMRGALPVLSERIAAKPEDTENRLNALGEVFSNLAPAYEQKVAAAQKENEKMQKRQDTVMQEEMCEEMRIRELAKQMLQSSQSFQQPIDPMGQAPQQQMGNPITDLLL